MLRDNASIWITLAPVLVACSAPPDSVGSRSAASQNDELLPPTLLHWVDGDFCPRLGEDELESAADCPELAAAPEHRASGACLIFTRSQLDTNQTRNKVDHYNVCIKGGGCFSTRRNFMNFPRPAADQPLTVTVASVDTRCAVGPPSAESTFAGADDLTLSFDLPASSDGLPETIPAPIHGPVVELGTAATSYKTASEWGCWQHQRKPPSGLHAKGQGLRRSDDTYAWDCNLAPGWGAAQGRGRALPFMSVGFGKVVRWGGEQGIETGTNAWHSILVDHVSGWFSGYLHGNIVYVRDGDLVTPASLLGTIGKAHAVGQHLHFAVYTGENVVGRYDVDPNRAQLAGLRSIDIGFDTECFEPGGWTEVLPCRSVGSVTGKSSFVAREFQLKFVDSAGAAFEAESVSLHLSDGTHPSLKLHVLGTRLDYGFPLLPGVRINDSANDFSGEWIKNLQYWTASNNRADANPDQKSISITQDGVIEAIAAGEADVQVYFSGGVQTKHVIVHEQELAP